MTTTQKSRPTPGKDQAAEAFRGATTTISQPSEYVAHFVMRMLQDALDSATAEFWVKRATDFESARPKPGEFHGRATPAELNERDRRCREQAQACRDHAQVLASMEFNDISPDVVDVLLEVV